MPDKPWKVAERKAARALGGVRNRMSGAVNQLTSGDVVHPGIYAEVKYRQRFAVLSEMRKVRKCAKKEGKIPVLVLQEAGKKTRYYVVPEQYLQALKELLP